MKKNLDKFRKYCDIYDIDDNYEPIIEAINNQKYTNLQTYHPLWYLFHWFDKLVKDNLTDEEFFMIWDVYSDFNVIDYQKQNKPNLQILEQIYQKAQDPDSYKNTLIIIDKRIYKWFEDNYPWDFEVLQKILEKKWSKILIW